MRSKGNNRTAVEKRWHETVADFAINSYWMSNTYYNAGCNYTQFHLDHFIGAQTKRKINFASEKVGEFAVIPVPIQLHDSQDTSNPCHRTKGFNEVIGDPKMLFVRMCSKMQEQGIELPFNDEWIEAITK